MKASNLFLKVKRHDADVLTDKQGVDAQSHTSGTSVRMRRTVGLFGAISMIVGLIIGRILLLESPIKCKEM